MVAKKVMYNPSTGRLEVFNVQTKAKKTAAKLDLIPDYEKQGKEAKSPLESLVQKFEESGYTIEQAFDLFDDNGDGVLTIKEIK